MKFGPQLMHFVARLLFRGIYFQQMTRWAWVKLLAKNLPTIASLVKSGLKARRTNKIQGPIPTNDATPESILEIGTAAATE
jgi:hypothetical protein